MNECYDVTKLTAALKSIATTYGTEMKYY